MPLVFYTFLAHDENRQAEKEEATADKEDGKKKRGGIQVPSEWPWEEAKKVFEQPDVTPSDQIEVGHSDLIFLSTLDFDSFGSWNGPHPMSKDWLISW